MENISKALLIAAGILFSVMLLSMLMITYNQISAHYQQEHELAAMEQLEKFNREFENYNRDNIRGNDLISLMNKIIDYNASQSYNEDIGQKRILVNITIGSSNIGKFKFQEDDESIIEENITNTGAGDNYTNDRDLVAITGTTSDLIERANGDPLNKIITDTELQKLSSEISNIVFTDEQEADEESAYAISNRFKRATLLKYILGLSVGTTNDYDIQINNETGKTVTGEEIIDEVKEIACQYYQYTQFKRACFRCTEVRYDTETKRIVEMNFEVQTNEDGNVIFD